MEDRMMGSQHERMEELMNKMSDGSPSEEEQQEMIDAMQNAQTGPGVMTMMMRMMGPDVMHQTGLRSQVGMIGYGLGPTVYWITILLIWTLLVTSIIALWRWMKK